MAFRDGSTAASAYHGGNWPLKGKCAGEGRNKFTDGFDAYKKANGTLPMWLDPRDASGFRPIHFERR